MRGLMHACLSESVLLSQCLQYTNAMVTHDICFYFSPIYNISSLIFPLKQFSMHITTGSCQAIANKGHAFAIKITQNIHIFTHLD